jgi:hypothetical protein
VGEPSGALSRAWRQGGAASVAADPPSDMPATAATSGCSPRPGPAASERSWLFTAPLSPRSACATLSRLRPAAPPPGDGAVTLPARLVRPRAAAAASSRGSAWEERCTFVCWPPAGSSSSAGGGRRRAGTTCSSEVQHTSRRASPQCMLSTLSKLWNTADDVCMGRAGQQPPSVEGTSTSACRRAQSQRHHDPAQVACTTAPLLLSPALLTPLPTQTHT